MTLVAIALMCAAIVANGFVLRLRYRVVAAAKAGSDPSVAVSRLRLRQGLIAAFASVSVILSGVVFHSTGFPGDAGVIPLLCGIFDGLEMVVALSQLEGSVRARRRRPQWRLITIRVGSGPMLSDGLGSEVDIRFGPDNGPFTAAPRPAGRPQQTIDPPDYA